jgi:hypothetical protein
MHNDIHGTFFQIPQKILGKNTLLGHLPEGIVEISVSKRGFKKILDRKIRKSRPNGRTHGVSLKPREIAPAGANF